MLTFGYFSIPYTYYDICLMFIDINEMLSLWFLVDLCLNSIILIDLLYHACLLLYNLLHFAINLVQIN